MSIRPLGILLAVCSVLSFPREATAESLAGFVDGLGQSGYEITIDRIPIPHPTLHVSGTPITAEKFGSVAKVELLEYGSQKQFAEDSLVLYDQAPKPRFEASELAGKSLYWHENSILIVDYASSSDAGTAWIVALVFVGRRGTSVEGLRVGIVPPGTGNGGLVGLRRKD